MSEATDRLRDALNPTSLDGPEDVRVVAVNADEYLAMLDVIDAAETMSEQADWTDIRLVRGARIELRGALARFREVAERSR